MNTVEKGKRKAERRQQKTGKKLAGQKSKQKMVVHGRPIERRELDKATFRKLTREGREDEKFKRPSIFLNSKLLVGYKAILSSP